MLWVGVIGMAGDTPAKLGIEGGGAEEMARSGFIMLSSPSLPDPDAVPA